MRPNPPPTSAGYSPTPPPPLPRSSSVSFSSLPHELTRLTELSNLFTHQHASSQKEINKMRNMLSTVTEDFLMFKRDVVKRDKERTKQIQGLLLAQDKLSSEHDQLKSSFHAVQTYLNRTPQPGTSGGVILHPPVQRGQSVPASFELSNFTPSSNMIVRAQSDPTALENQQQQQQQSGAHGVHMVQMQPPGSAVSMPFQEYLETQPKPKRQRRKKDDDSLSSDSEDEHPNVPLYKYNDPNTSFQFTIPYSTPGPLSSVNRATTSSLHSNNTVYTPGKCCTTSLELYYAKDRAAVKCRLEEFYVGGSSNWKSRKDYTYVQPKDRARIAQTVAGICKASKVKSVEAEMLDLFPGNDDNNVSALILYEKETPVCVATFTISFQTSRCFAELYMVRTRKGFRRRGHGKTAMAVIKEFILNNPTRGQPMQSFIWTTISPRSQPFFTHPTVGFLSGWSRFTEVTGELPRSRPNFLRAHSVVSKQLSGEYLKSCSSGFQSPLVLSNTRKKNQDHDLQAEFNPGTAVLVHYPKVGSLKLYQAVILDYNPLLSRPYYVEYEDKTTEHIVRNRISKKEEKEEGGKVKESPKPGKEGGGEGGGQVSHDLFNMFKPGP
ncbi:hypothetical protein TL16_g06257 [Triparma laevis f. inornata]|uniref:Uncharacterized protein n=1 Tax=Triparma laevis f. inornata TaxID=1714386 RepID=A0A9W7ARC0_9STRA|nr:hypothetical protein TL16_g06257 [Triparma laevis f. inornata]